MSAEVFKSRKGIKIKTPSPIGEKDLGNKRIQFAVTIGTFEEISSRLPCAGSRG